MIVMEDWCLHHLHANICKATCEFGKLGLHRHGPTVVGNPSDHRTCQLVLVSRSAAFKEICGHAQQQGDQRCTRRMHARVLTCARHFLQALFVRKLHLCAFTFDFTSPTYVREKEIKRQALLELVDYVNSGAGVSLCIYTPFPPHDCCRPWSQVGSEHRQDHARQRMP